MSVSSMFSEFISNLVISNADIISTRYGEVTAALNKKFRDTESKTANSLQVGSFGRNTAIDGISDLDMLYIMPQTSWSDYSDENGPRRILNQVRDAILGRYPDSDVRVDQCVVSITYTDFHIEIQPVFEQEDQSYKYPDTYDNCWKITRPREEIQAISDMDSAKNGNLRNLCKIVRAWKNKCGVEAGGLLIDTLTYRFLDKTKEYDDKSYLYYDLMSRDFFKFLSEEPEQSFYLAPGSNQQVKVKQKFQAKAKKAYNMCLEAIAAEDQLGVNDKWKKIYGRPFPAASDQTMAFAAPMAINASKSICNTEEFIEDSHPVDIRYSLKIDCDVSQNGFREYGLRDMLARHIPLLTRKSLRFTVSGISVPPPYQIKWKVLNRGEEAIRRNEIRGQIVDDNGQHSKVEHTKFKGDHIVECYAVKSGVVVAKDRIHVPISTTE